MEVSGQLHAPVALPPGNNPGFGAPHNRPGRFGEGKNLLRLPGFEPRAVQPVLSLIWTQILTFDDHVLCVFIYFDRRYY
jgi:hypothetical protein